jgi:hypothetical protein
MASQKKLAQYGGERAGHQVSFLADGSNATRSSELRFKLNQVKPS